MAQVLCNLQNHLELVRGVLREESTVGGLSLDTSTNDVTVGLVLTSGRCLAQTQDVGANLDKVVLGERRATGDARAIEEGAVAAADILDEVAASFAEDPGMLAADGEGFEIDIHVRLAANERGVSCQREALARVGPFDRD